VLDYEEPTRPKGSTERRVLYEGGLDVDFLFFPRAAALATGREAPTTEFQSMVSRGWRVILDKDGLLNDLATATVAPPGPSSPTRQQFENTVHHYLYHVLWTAKHLRRGEVWSARSCLEGLMNGLILRMIEWHSSLLAPDLRTPLQGSRFLERRADPRAVARLADATSRYDHADVARALPENHRLFRSLARGVAEDMGWGYPESADSQVVRLAAGVLTQEERPK
jgi:aminoglycoside 6-adenylyltransferase